MKSFFALTKKEFFHILRDVRTMMFLFLMPIIQILLFGFALSTEVNHIKFGVLDLSKDNMSEKIITNLSFNPSFELVKIFHSKNELESAFSGTELDLVLVFDENFARNLARKEASIELLLDGSEPNLARMVSLYTNISINSFLKISQSPIITRNTTLFNPQGESVYNFLPGILGMIMLLICAMMTSVSIVREKELGSMGLLLISPLKPLMVIVAKFIPYFVISLLSLIAVLLVSVWILKMQISGNLVLLMSFCMLYIALGLSIGLMVSNLVKSQVSAMLICALIFLMPTMIFSGMIFPIESMGIFLQYLSHIIPAKWFISGLRKVMIEGLELRFIWQEFSILFLMFLCTLLISLKSFKIRL